MESGVFVYTFGVTGLSCTYRKRSMCNFFLYLKKMNGDK